MDIHFICEPSPYRFYAVPTNQDRNLLGIVVSSHKIANNVLVYHDSAVVNMLSHTQNLAASCMSQFKLKVMNIL